VSARAAREWAFSRAFVVSLCVHVTLPSWSENFFALLARIIANALDKV
jgi:hypothetical protein